MILRTHLEVQLGRGQNDREHHMARHRRWKAEQEQAHWALVIERGREPQPVLPVRVTMTRISPSTRGGLDSDNLHGSLKGTRDGIAEFLGVDDADPRIEWVPAQRKGPWGLDIEIEEVRHAAQETAAAAA